MTAYKPPRKGQTIRLIFEGEVTAASSNNVRFRMSSGGSAGVTWGAGAIYPEVEIIDQGAQRGDVGVYTSPDGGVTSTVVYRPREVFHGLGSDAERPEGWYSAGNAPYGFMAPLGSPHVRLVMLADGTPVES